LPAAVRRGPLSTVVTVVTGLAVVVVAMVGLGVQAIRGNRTVNIQRSALTVHNAALDNAFYRCIDVQAHSLISPHEPILFSDNVADLADLVSMIKAVGSWVTIADPDSSAVAHLGLRDNVTGHGACLGTVVVATYSTPHHGVRTRIGSGASVPGQGPPPAPPF
jgi:hypothetical protein